MRARAPARQSLRSLVSLSESPYGAPGLVPLLVDFPCQRAPRVCARLVIIHTPSWAWAHGVPAAVPCAYRNTRTHGGAAAGGAVVLFIAAPARPARGVGRRTGTGRKRRRQRWCRASWCCVVPRRCVRLPHETTRACMSRGSGGQ